MLLLREAVLNRHGLEHGVLRLASQIIRHYGVSTPATGSIMSSWRSSLERTAPPANTDASDQDRLSHAQVLPTIKHDNHETCAKGEGIASRSDTYCLTGSRYMWSIDMDSLNDGSWRKLD